MTKAIRTLNRHDYPLSRLQDLKRGDTIKLTMKKDGNDVYLEDKVSGKTKVDTLSVMELTGVPGFKGQCRALVYGQSEEKP